MSMRRKSLLDAFRAVPPGKGTAARPGESMAVPQRPSAPPLRPVVASAQAATPTAAPTPAASPARVMAAGPAPARAAPARVATPRAIDAPASAPMSRDRKVLLTLLAITIAVIGYLAWRGGPKGEVSADTGAAQAAVTSGKPAAPAPTPAATNVGTTADDRAFFETKNKFTIRVAQLDNDAAGTAMAQSAYRYLLTEGLPAVRPIVALDGQHIVLCVNAKPKVEDLTSMRDYARSLRGPTGGKKLPFSDAWIDNIEHVVKR